MYTIFSSVNQKVESLEGKVLSSTKILAAKHLLTDWCYSHASLNTLRTGTQICVFTLQLCKTDDANLRF